jgi:uncharacterized protein YndB with AHSA1/START domain/predicted enzyme related to lactoylglutathione lyase
LVSLSKKYLKLKKGMFMEVLELHEEQQSISSQVTSPTTMILRRFIKASPERVWQAWTNPEEVVKWFGPETCYAVWAKKDVRPGGEYAIRVKGQEIPDSEVRGSYQEVSEPSRLVYTWKWSGNTEVDFGESLVTVDFREVDGNTDLQVIQEGLPNAEVRDDHLYGWSGSLEKLEKHLGVKQCRGAAYGSFCWNELMTSSVSGASAFYKNLLGWETAAFGEGADYTLWKKREKDLGGMMASPEPGAPSQWIPYIFVENADATAQKAGSLGGKICLPPSDIPTIGRIAVLQDPQGAAFGVITPARREKND